MKIWSVATVLACATAAVAAPSYNPSYNPTKNKAISKEEFVNKCGRNNVSCCNKEVERKEVSPTISDGPLNLLNGLHLDSISVFDQCSKLDIPSMYHTFTKERRK